jgi:hypothetical protein
MATSAKTSKAKTSKARRAVSVRDLKSKKDPKGGIARSDVRDAHDRY